MQTGRLGPVWRGMIHFTIEMKVSGLAFVVKSGELVHALR